MCNRKRCTYLKGLFKTSSKSRIIKLLVNSRSSSPPPFTCKPLTISLIPKVPIISFVMENILVLQSTLDTIYIPWFLISFSLQPAISGNDFQTWNYGWIAVILYASVAALKKVLGWPFFDKIYNRFMGLDNVSTF